MATPKKRKKVRDSEATKKKLLEAVGEIIRGSGFHALGVNRISQVAEKDRSMIRYHFDGLSGLLKTYIQEQDYWPPFFERFKIDELADPSEVRELFMALLNENLRQFYKSPEMQKIILWQITKDSALLREVSEKREDEGEKLFELTNETFVGSGINFKAIIALLLGGTYFAVLQSQSIRTRVCGVDLNWEKDFKVFSNTISQVIGWAWEKAEEAKKSLHQPMENVLEKLEKIVGDLCDDLDQHDGRANTILLSESERVERLLVSHLLSLTNETQVVTFLQHYLPVLVSLCDRVYSIESGSHENAQVLLDLIEAVRRPVSQHVPESMALPKLFLYHESEKLSWEWNELSKKLEAKGIDPKLIEIIAIPVERCLNGSAMKWYDYKYLRRYLSVLIELSSGQFTQQLLLDVMVGLGFNHRRFCAYYAYQLKSALPDDPREARAYLRDQRLRMGKIDIYTQRSFDPYKLPVVQELERWMDVKLAKIGYEATETVTAKLATKFKAVELAFWMKLQYDHGVFEENSLESFSAKIASSFSTKGKEELSASSIKSKFYPKDKAVLAPMAELLEQMLEDVKKFL